MKAKIERNIAIIRKKTRFVALAASNRDKRSILFVLFTSLAANTDF